MTKTAELLKTCLADLPPAIAQTLVLLKSIDGLSTGWLSLEDPQQLVALATGLKAAGGRLVTTTVFRPDPETHPDRHEIAYHLILEDLPVTVKLTLEKDQAAPSITSIFLNADWEEREMMELSDILIEGHPDPRRLFLDESIDAGVFDRYVPFSEMTNLANADAVWDRIRKESQSAQQSKTVVANNPSTS